MKTYINNPRFTTKVEVKQNYDQIKLYTFITLDEQKENEILLNSVCVNYTVSSKDITHPQDPFSGADYPIF